MATKSIESTLVMCIWVTRWEWNIFVCRSTYDLARLLFIASQVAGCLALLWRPTINCYTDCSLTTRVCCREMLKALRNSCFSAKEELWVVGKLLLSSCWEFTFFSRRILNKDLTYDYKSEVTKRSSVRRHLENEPKDARWHSLMYSSTCAYVF